MNLIIEKYNNCAMDMHLLKALVKTKCRLRGPKDRELYIFHKKLFEVYTNLKIRKLSDKVSITYQPVHLNSSKRLLLGWIRHFKDQFDLYMDHTLLSGTEPSLAILRKSKCQDHSWPK